MSSMIKTVKTVFGRIKAEDELIVKTENKLRILLADSKRRSVFQMKKTAFAVCAVIVLLGLSIGGYAYYQTPVSYLSLDINPSVELGVNAFGRVVSAVGYNEDGQLILEGYNVINITVNDAVKKLVVSASENGFINEDGSTIISLTAETDSEKTAVKLQKAAEQGANNALAEHGNTAVVYKNTVTLDRVEAAKTIYHITPGKLNLIQKLQALDPSITVEQYKDASVKDIMKKFVELHNGYSTQTDVEAEDIENAAEQSNANESNHKNTDKNKTNENQSVNGNSQPSASSSGGSDETVDEGKNGNGKNNKDKDTSSSEAHGKSAAKDGGSD